MNGFLNVLKPPGMSSSQVVGQVRRLLAGEKAGHAGTLDPQAAGILPVMVGRAARLFDYLADKEKAYVAEIAFGAATDTQDAQGRIILTGDAYPSFDMVNSVLSRFEGQLMQTPPAYSALKQGGQRLYDLARRGETVTVPPRPVMVESMTLLRETENHGMMLHIRCGRGTYVRTLCHDIGLAVSCPAHMRFLLRTKTGAFTLDNARTLEELQAAAREGKLQDCLFPMDMPLQHLPGLTVPKRLISVCRHGGKMPLQAFPEAQSIAVGAPFRLYDGYQFLGIAEKREGVVAFRAMMSAQADE